MLYAISFCLGCYKFRITVFPFLISFLDLSAVLYEVIAFVHLVAISSLNIFFYPSFPIRIALYCIVLAAPWFPLPLVFVFYVLGWEYWWERVCRIFGTWCSKTACKNNFESVVFNLNFQILVDELPFFCLRFLVAADRLWEKKLHYVSCACIGKIRMLSM